MFQVRCDSNCYKREEHFQNNPRYSGVYELLDIFVYPFSVAILTFVILLINNYTNFRNQRKIVYRRFFNSSEQPWHMHTELKKCLIRMHSLEKLNRKEMGNSILDTKRMNIYMEKQKNVSLKPLEERIVIMRESAMTKGLQADSAATEAALPRKMILRQEVDDLNNEVERLTRRHNRIQSQYITERRHKYAGIMPRKAACHIFWSPVDTLISYLNNRNMMERNRVWRTMPTATLDDIYH